MYDFSFQERIGRREEARDMARRILGVSEGASPGDLKRAWRRACKENHPDQNPGDPRARRRFAAVNCAYRLLAFGEPCGMDLEKEQVESSAPRHRKYRLDNAWGFFLWWRDRFF
jgi:hypothetical protein